MKATMLLLLALIWIPSRATAEPCGAVPARTEIATTLRQAAEARPVHVTFRTRAEGVKIPDDLLPKYPEEMTIVLQYEFDRLVVKDDRFEVGLWFKGRHARLVVPFDAIKGFYDTTERKCGGD